MHRRRRLAAAALSFVLAAAGMTAAAVEASAASARATVLQLNAAEGTETCAHPNAMDCLAPLRGSNANRDMYAVEEVCRDDYSRFIKQTGWHGIFRAQTTRLKGASGTGCKYKGDMLVSPHRVTNQKTYTLSAGFKANHVRHEFLMVCGLIHAGPAFFGCATHLVFPKNANRTHKQEIQVGNLVKDTRAYRSRGRTVIAGDFNVAESGAGAGATPRLKPIVNAGYQETDKDKTPTHGSRKFDYIFYFGKGGVRARAALTGDVSTSDHRVLLGEAVF